jgi:hypothetical protein
MNQIIYKGAVNPLSFGNVSYNLLREMYRRKINVAFFPFGDKLNFESFNKIEEDFRDWVISSAQSRFQNINAKTKTLSQWHINGSESRISKNQTLFTFYESDQPTSVEKSIVELQDDCIFSSKHAFNKFKDIGCQNIHYVPIGFDEDFKPSSEEYLPNKVHFGLMGKFEKRKNTAQIIQNWIKTYGNNYDYQLTCCINNSFFEPKDMNNLISQCLGGQTVGNVNFLPHLKTNSEVNEFINAIDIDLSGLSGAEGWNLPAFNATALGKWSVVMNHTSHKDWADSRNSILIEPDKQVPIYDKIFFQEGSPFSQGNMNAISDEKMISSFKDAEKICKTKNEEGLKLQKEFTYKKTL